MLEDIDKINEKRVLDLIFGDHGDYERYVKTIMEFGPQFNKIIDDAIEAEEKNVPQS
jgi:hypothetical protein